MEDMINHQRVKELRQQKAWSQEQLASIAGISYRTVQRVERDGKASLETQKSIAAAFDIGPEQLTIDDAPKADVEAKRKGIVWGYAGVILGFLCAAIAITIDMQAGGTSPAVAGVSLGLLGAITGLSCAAMGYFSRR